MVQKGEKLITFKYDVRDMFIPPVIPASEALPTWYKKMAFATPSSESWDFRGTVKACMPMFDAMTQGYIIPLWADIHVTAPANLDPENEENQPIFAWNKEATTVVEPHGPDQTVGLPVISKALGAGMSFKFNNPWIIETPEGYSTLFISPLNNANPHFEMISAIVATDSYPCFINFPFVWKGPPDWEGVIPTGTPVIQLIPFKRDDFRHEIGVMSLDAEKRNAAGHKALGSMFHSVYKNLWRKIIRSV